MTLLSADLKWNELISIINKLNKQRLSEEDIRNLAYHQRCQLLNSNPVLVARHFQYRVEVFFKEIRVEFQVRGSPHMHCFLWVMNTSVLNLVNKEEYVAFVDQITHAFLPDRNENQELHELVKLYQLHRHSKVCKKYKNEVCRFKFRKFFTKETLVAEPLLDSMTEEMNVLILHKRSEIL